MGGGSKDHACGVRTSGALVLMTSCKVPHSEVGRGLRKGYIDVSKNQYMGGRERERRVLRYRMTAAGLWMRAGHGKRLLWAALGMLAGLSPCLFLAFRLFKAETWKCPPPFCSAIPRVIRKTIIPVRAKCKGPCLISQGFDWLNEKDKRYWFCFLTQKLKVAPQQILGLLFACLETQHLWFSFIGLMRKEKEHLWP